MFFKLSITLQSGEYPKWGVLSYILVHSTSFNNHVKFLNFVKELNFIFYYHQLKFRIIVVMTFNFWKEIKCSLNFQ